MNAADLPADPARTATAKVRFEPLTMERLDAVLTVERAAYQHPWTRGNFAETLAADHQAQCLMAGEELLGYFVALRGFQEVHLLNITVAPTFQRQGWALAMLDALALWSRAQGAERLWLEVRVSNARAQKVYLERGFSRVGMRKDYYPLRDGEREDAVVMSLRLEPI
jgi:ribosomal-protein-alanine N-acetyltransferase